MRLPGPDESTATPTGRLPTLGGMEQRRLFCWECLVLADDRAAGWRAYRADVPGEDPEPILLFCCPACFERELGRLAGSEGPAESAG